MRDALGRLGDHVIAHGIDRARVRTGPFAT